MDSVNTQHCLFWMDHWSTCLTKSEWAGWMQAVGAVVAVLVAIAVPVVQSWRSRRKTRQGLLEMIAMDVLLAERQARVYLNSKYKVPAYRLPLYGEKLALPALLADGTINRGEATALAQFYMDARSFNHCLDLAQQLVVNDGNWRREVDRVTLKAKHLVPGTPLSRYEPALRVMRKHLPRESLERLEVDAKADNSENIDD